MYLKSLEVHGFKSFANKLVFEFHNGITAIVGPNGSGKSNVADAVRWVLGEQSAKQLRGAKMEDVIFAGTQLRKPQGFAYVAITINNEDHKLKVPYEEVKIARRVYRSGESEYLLNGASCRLRDIQELLFDTGIGKEGYSIIGQGQIDKILSGKPEERRELFDEAAGIVKFKKRKNLAEKNLEEEEQNLVRIEDILSELEKQVEPLEKQSEKAKEYLSFRDELRNLDINVFLQDYKEHHNELEELQSKEEIAARDLQKAQADFEKAKADYGVLEQQLETQNKNLEECKETLVGNRVKCNQQEGDIKVLREQINAVRQSENYYREQMQTYQSRIQSLEEDKEGFGQKEEELKTQLQEVQKKQETLAKERAGLLESAATIEAEIAEHNRKIMAAMDATTDVASQEERFQTLLEQNNIKKAQLTKRVLENKTKASEIEQILEKERRTLQDVDDKISALESAGQELASYVASLDAKIDDLQREQREVQQRYHMDNSRLHSLQNMTERYEGFGQSIKRVMEQKAAHKGIIGVVADIIRVNKQYEIAVETALGGSIQNIVTDNEQTAKSMIQLLKKNRYGRATFLPLTNIHARKANVSGNILSEPGVIGMASELVQTEDRFSELMEYLLGRFVVVDQIDNAIALAKKYHHTIRIVTTEGELLNPGGSMSGGAFKNNNNLLGRRREMEELEKQVASHGQAMRELAKSLQDQNKEQEQLRTKIEANRKLRQELVLQQNTAKLNIQRAENDMAQNQEILGTIQFESREIEQEKQELQTQLSGLQDKRKETESQNQKYEAEIASCNEQLEQNKQKSGLLNEQEADARLEQGNLEQQVQFQRENRDRVEQELQKTRQDMQEAQENNRQADGRVKEKEEQILELQNKMEQMKLQIETLTQMVEEKTKARDELQEKQKGFLENRENLSQLMNELDKECFRIRNNKEKVQEKIDSYTSYMWEQYELTYSKAEELKVELSMSMAEMRSKIKSLKSAIKGLGDVNVNAIEQYRELMERYDLLHGQHDDLIQAAEVLRGVIRDLDEEMRKQFEEQFAEIQVRFDKVFKELFGGGRGALELTEGEDVLEAGIRIVAQPPGKKLQNMMQMSGGEKALTAIALLFAIQSLKPSPFCLLDEIEAALDDSNVGRYASYLHKLTKNTQFIVITHRRGTMNAADILYGITMQEKGVSTLVSVSL
ncbi:MAG: chromosome segregation protein SMC, partial [Lachnospiraceae bacterium]|nr:chromosome segregation protein SMC [Lachnospiraceae bacterium]